MGPVDRVASPNVQRAWAARVRPELFDAALAALLLAAGLVALSLADPGDPVWLAVVLTLALTGPLAIRRRRPLVVTGVVTASVVAQSALIADGSQPLVPIALAVVAYTAGHELDSRAAWAGAAMIIAPLWIGLALSGSEPGEFISVLVIFGAIWAFGRGLRHRVELLTERTESLEHEAAEREQAAMAAERTRIARELHDIVSHSISVIAVQSQAVRRRLGPEPVRERQDLEGIEATAREAMVEMRRLFGVLSAPDGVAALAPQPGLVQLNRLVEQARESGLQVELDITGTRRPLPPGLDLTAYRVVQEALTNVRKHAPSARAHVLIRFTAGQLDIAVDDSGGKGAGPDRNGEPSNGHGLIGMRERVALYGGTLETARLADGGFRVHARLPVSEV